MGCGASVDVQQTSTKPIENHLNQPLAQQKQQKEQTEEQRLLEEAKRLEKDQKYAQAIQLYLKVQDLPSTKAEAFRGLGGCYRMKSKYDQAIKYSLQSYNLEKHQECCRSLGICYRAKKDYKSSIEWLSRGLEIKPNSAPLYSALGVTYKAMNELQKTEEYYKKAVQLDNTYELGLERLADLYSDKNRYEQSIKIYQKLFELNPKKISPLFNIALIYKNKIKDMNEAMKFLNKAIEIDQKYSFAYNTMRNIKLTLNLPAQAEVYFRKAIQIEPKFKLAHNGLGNSFYERKLYNQAKQCYLKSIQCDATYSTPYSGLGDSYWKLGQLDKAIQSYLKTIQLDPKDDNPYNGIGNVYKTKGDIQQSIKWLKKASEVNPNNQHPYNGLGNAYKQLNMYDLAIQNYLKSIKVDPKFSFPFNGLGNIYYAKKELDEAEKWYRKGIEVDPNYETIYNNLGNLYINYRNNSPQAIEFYKKSISLNPKYQAAYNGLGTAYNSQGKVEEAIETYSKAIEINNSYSLAYVNMAICYIKIENYPEAFKILKKAKEIIDHADRDVFGGCKGFITAQLAKFETEMAEWQYKSKLGYLTKEDIERIQNLRKQFENKFNNLFNSSEENMGEIDPNQFRLQFINVLDKIKEDGFTLSHIEQIAGIDFKLFRQNMDDFSIMPFMFCKYFWEQKMVGKKSIKQIEELLEAKIGKLNELFPPSVASSNESPSLTLKRQVPQKTVNLFKEIEYFKDYRYLVKEIQSLHQTSHLVLPKFKDMIYRISAECGGYHSKANLKLPEKENERFKVYIRVMEKMFKEVKARKAAIVDKIDQKITNGKKVSMQAVMEYLVEVWTEEISDILKARSEGRVPTVCNITDFVRGKSMFKSVQHIEAAANRLIDELDGLGYEITEIDNRLKKETRDLVFKILIDGIVCEYQIALETDSVQYNYSHCYYEIKRSPLGCIFGSYLFLSKYEVLSFARQAKEICAFYKYKRDEEALKRTQAAQFLIEALEKNI